MTKTSIATTAIALGLMASAGPANAYYYRYGYDPGAAIALGILGGALAGATIASQGYYGYYGYYGYPPVYPAYPVYGARCSPVPVYDSWGNFAGYRTACW